MAEYWESDDMKEMADQLIREHHTHLATAEIGYLFRDTAQKKKLTLDGSLVQVVRGNVSKVSAGKYDPYINLDFLIEIPYEEWKEWTSTQRYYELDTRLSMIQGEEDDKSGEMKFFLVPFPVMLFPDVAQRWGLPFDEDRDAGYVIADALKKSNDSVKRAAASLPDSEEVAEIDFEFDSDEDGI